MNDKGEQGSSSGGRFHFLQPNRDLESNWDVNLAKKLEEYLLKICSGEIASADEVDGHTSVNFAEAALLIQGSIQVYSRKVEYLYSLVLHALRFISQRSQDQAEEATTQPDCTDSPSATNEENESFLGLDHVPEEAKNCLDDGLGKDDAFNPFVKPPANLLVLEGDCLDTIGGAGELELYLLATSDLYRDFLLLDPCDATSVDDYLRGKDATDEGHNSVLGISSTQSRVHKSCLLSPRSKGSAQRSNQGKSPHSNQKPSGVASNSNVGHNEENVHLGADTNGFPEENMYHVEDMDGGFFEPRDDSDDEDDPWKPLDPHEPGNLRVKPFRKGRIYGRQRTRSTKQSSIAAQFPLARLEDIVSPEFAESLEAKVHSHEEHCDPKSPLLYEKLRKSLMLGENETNRGSENLMDENGDHDFGHESSDFEEADFGFDGHGHIDAAVPLPHEQNNDDVSRFDTSGAFGQDDPSSQASLEDLCRSHLDSLLASIAETEKQTELAARVSTWKQRIEYNLEEQDSHPPFDIHAYGEQILDKLSSDVDNGGYMSFADVVAGQVNYDVSRIFSAMLQLVNNLNISLDRGESEGKSICHTRANPFHVQLLDQGKKQDEAKLHSSKKRVRSPSRKRFHKNQENRPPVKNPTVGSSLPGKSSTSNGKFSIKLGKATLLTCTPQGKRRRRAQPIIESVNL